MCVIVLVTVFNCIDKSNDFLLVGHDIFYTITEFQSTNGCGLIQSRLNPDWWALTLESNLGKCRLNYRIRTPV